MVYKWSEVMMYTVKQLARLAGISNRTLHYYDQIGLLAPSRLGGNGYRYYDETALLRLQQILFFRELDINLQSIREILDQPGFDLVDALQSHRQALQARRQRLERLMATIDQTIKNMKEKKPMQPRNLFAGFSEEEQEQYAKEAEKLYDQETVKASNRRWKAYSQSEKDRILAEGSRIYTELIDAIPLGAADATVQALIARWHANMQYFWSPADAQLLALADGYNTDPRFKSNFDQMHPELAEFMSKAVAVYVESRKKP
jgi:DNA-binding transcriptional MerR regulator